MYYKNNVCIIETHITDIMFVKLSANLFLFTILSCSVFLYCLHTAKTLTCDSLTHYSNTPLLRPPIDLRKNGLYNGVVLLLS